MRDGDPDQQAHTRRGERIFVASCVFVFVVIAACAVYFVVRLLA
jgi:hypothetical protein